MEILKSITFIFISFILVTSCTPIKPPAQSQQIKIINTENKDENVTNDKNKNNQPIKEPDIIQDNLSDKNLSQEITVLFSNESKDLFTKQFINILELAIHNKKFENVTFDIQFFNNNKELDNIISISQKKGKIFIGPVETKYTTIAKEHCDHGVIFFAFSSETSLADKCVYLINFFPKNELDQLFISLSAEAKIALLYPENKYGYIINSLIDNSINLTEAVLVNRASYKNDLSNVRSAIKELGKYELRKYELERQKKILSLSSDSKSIKRLKKLQKFKTTSDYDFTHILIADYGLNLLQVAPLLPYYDIDPNVVQFIGTGVLDDENFFYEPSLQGTIFPGIEKTNRAALLEQYQEIYNEKMLRISTLPYDLVGLLQYVYTREMSFNQLIDLLNNPSIKFDGVDGKFYFNKNMIERELDILKIENGQANKINLSKN
tara:strand:- start:957 stop:2261 length:1305 start_codon:yes stop_codon:yes gene_type:complete